MIRAKCIGQSAIFSGYFTTKSTEIPHSSTEMEYRRGQSALSEESTAMQNDLFE